MEDELEQDGMEEEAGEPQPEKGGGSPLIKIIIIGVMAVVAIIIVFFSGLNPFLGDEPVDGEEPEEIQNIISTEWGKEYILNEDGITHSMLDDRGRVKNLVIHTTLVTENDGTGLFLQRTAQLTYLIKSEFNKYSGQDFKKILEQQYQDSIMIDLRNKFILNLPLKDIVLLRVLVEIVTM